MSRLALLALACSSILAAQEPAATEPDLSSLSLVALIDRLPPVGEEWIREGSPWQLVPVAAEFRERIERVELSDEQWNRALTRTGVLRSRERWPAAEPFALSLRAPGWLPLTRIELDPDEPGLASASAGEVRPIRVHYPRVVLHQELGPLPAGTQHLDFTLQVGVFHRGRLRLPVTLVPTLDEVLPPASTPELDRAVRESLYLTLDYRGAFLCGLGSLEGPLHGLARSLRAEVYYGRELREVVTLSPTGNPDGLEPPFDAVSLARIPDALFVDAGAREGWSVRVQGRCEGALRSWGCDRRWSGTLEVPFAELLTREPRIPPRWR